MKLFAACLAASFLASAPQARAEPLARLFESSRLWETPASVKPSKVAHAKSHKKNIARQIASEPVSVVQTYVYGSDYSFAKSESKSSVERDIASIDIKGRVISVRREISLTDAESKGVEQEFVINAGSRAGLTKGTKLKVYRNLPVVDLFNGNKQLEMKVDFATVEVVHVEEDLAVAQLTKLATAAGSPYVGLRGVLVGDYVSLR